MFVKFPGVWNSRDWLVFAMLRLNFLEGGGTCSHFKSIKITDVPSTSYPLIDSFRQSILSLKNKIEDHRRPPPDDIKQPHFSKDEYGLLECQF